MDIILKYELFYDELNRIKFNEDLFEKHPEEIESLFVDEEINVKVYQRVANKKFFDRIDNYSIAVQWLVNDIKDKKSILSQFFKDKFLEEKTALERNIQIFKVIFPLLVLRQFRDPKAYGINYYLEYYRKNGVKFFLPADIILDTYGENYHSIDLRELDKDVFIEFVIPEYYLALAYAGIKKPKATKEDLLSNLGREWFNEENHIVPAVELVSEKNNQ